jgi:hypothetical protein
LQWWDSWGGCPRQRPPCPTQRGCLRWMDGCRLCCAFKPFELCRTATSRRNKGHLECRQLPAQRLQAQTLWLCIALRSVHRVVHNSHNLRVDVGPEERWLRLPYYYCKLQPETDRATPEIEEKQTAKSISYACPFRCAQLKNPLEVVGPHLKADELVASGIRPSMTLGGKLI